MSSPTPNLRRGSIAFGGGALGALALRTPVIAEVYVAPDSPAAATAAAAPAAPLAAGASAGIGTGAIVVVGGPLGEEEQSEEGGGQGMRGAGHGHGHGQEEGARAPTMQVTSSGGGVRTDRAPAAPAMEDNSVAAFDPSLQYE
jgi:hypothetical protein